MANDQKLTSIVIKPGEVDQGKEQLKEVLTQLWSDKAESHYIAIQFGAREFWLKVDAKQLQILYCDKDHLALLGSLKTTLDDFIVDKMPKGHVYFHDIDQDQRLRNSQSGINTYPLGSPQERLEQAHIEKVMPSPGRHGLFGRNVQPEKPLPDVKIDETKEGPRK